ncbi:hypothetical protein LIER_42598 [Lithospermum erythrorhizon]|uniref:Uncharacterized protein n=1 Tax=Lithospermum erythrorhizon TaxID=34254 RepID=A0AAV3NLY3_LITER
MTGGSNQRSSYNQTRPKSPVLLVDPETLAFCRLYTTLGAEISMGDLHFTPHHDPFANMELPQEVVENISRTLNDAPESEYMEVLSLIRKPLTRIRLQNLPPHPPPLFLLLGQVSLKVGHPLLTQLILLPLTLLSSGNP